MAYAEMDPEQFIATLDEWLDDWANGALRKLGCGACDYQLSADRMFITSARSWSCSLQCFVWLHLVHVTCQNCNHVARFDAQAVTHMRMSEVFESDRARQTEPAPD